MSFYKNVGVARSPERKDGSYDGDPVVPIDDEKCFVCGHEIEEEDPIIIYHVVSGGAYFHAVCAYAMANRIMMDFWKNRVVIGKTKGRKVSPFNC